MENIEFEDFLKKKRISPADFREHEGGRYEEFRQLFEQVHPKSFVQQKLFLINVVRRRYPLMAEDAPKAVAKKKPARPVMRKKPG